MPGQGYHDGMLTLIVQRAGKKVTREEKVGNLFPDAANAAAGSRRKSHFCGGAGAVYPRLTELRQCSTIQSWDSEMQKSFLVDPKIDMRLFEAANKHIPESDYKDGLRIHFIVDREYDKLVQGTIFDVSKQKDNIIKVRATGKEMDGTTFRKELYKSYPMLDQYVMRLAGVTADEIEDDKEMLRATMNDAHAEFICKYLNYNEEFVWEDTDFFTKEIIDQLIEDTIQVAINYLKW